MTKKQSAARNKLEYYFDADNSEIMLLRKKMFFWIANLYALILFTALISGITGFNGIRSAQWISISATRSISILTVLFSIILSHHNRIRTAENILVFISILNIVIHFLVGLDVYSPLSLVFILTSTVLPLQIINLLIKEKRVRTILNFSVVTVFYSIGFYLLYLLPQEDRADGSVILFTASFMFMMLIFPGYVSTFVKNSLDEIILQKSLIDERTGLKNSIMLNKDLSELLNTAHSKEKTIKIFALYIPNFGKVIEKFGYDIGNKLLKEIGLRLSVIENEFHLYTISTALFAIIPDRTDVEINEEKIQKFVNVIFNRNFIIDSESIELNHIIVGTESPSDGRSAQRLISNLHNTSYSMSGIPEEKNLIQWFDHESHKIAERRFILENDLKKMIKNNEFNLLIQPKINLTDGTIHGGEFLSRWLHPSLGQISPIEFIPLLDENGLMEDFTIAISNEVIKCCKDIQEEKGHLVLAINVNASILKKKSFIDFIISFGETISPQLLEIELTEDIFMQMDNKLNQNIKKLKDNNIHLALDDFGTGFSNVSYLQELDVDTIKIDKRFITPLQEEGSSYGIVKALIDMAHTFNIKVVAEGVENQLQNSILTKLGCDLIQGYFYYKPMELEEFKLLLQ